jgi:hypothetical protein
MVAAGESEEDIALVIQRMSRAEPTPEPTRGLEQLHTDAMRSKGLEPTASGLQFSRQMEDGVLGGGVTGGLVNTAVTPALGVGQKFARRLISGLLKPNKALKEGFGGSQELAGTLLENRAPITQRGLTKITDRLTGSRNTAMDMVRAAEQQGTQGVVPKDVISEFAPVVQELRKRIDIGQTGNMAQVGARGKAILRTAGRGGGDIPLTRAQALKETAQDASSGAYRAMERGGQKQLSADDLLDTAVARGLRQGIERKVPGVGPQNKITQGLIGGRNALEDALERESNNLGIGGAKDALAMMAGGGAIAAGAGPMAAPLAITTRLLATPSTGSMAAIALNEASKSGVLDASTRAALLALLRDRE